MAAPAAVEMDEEPGPTQEQLAAPALGLGNAAPQEAPAAPPTNRRAKLSADALAHQLTQESPTVTLSLAFRSPHTPTHPTRALVSPTPSLTLRSFVTAENFLRNPPHALSPLYAHQDAAQAMSQLRKDANRPKVHFVDVDFANWMYADSAIAYANSMPDNLRPSFVELDQNDPTQLFTFDLTYLCHTGAPTMRTARLLINQALRDPTNLLPLPPVVSILDLAPDESKSNTAFLHVGTHSAVRKEQALFKLMGNTRLRQVQDPETKQNIATLIYNPLLGGCLRCQRQNHTTPACPAHHRVNIIFKQGYRPTVDTALQLRIPGAKIKFVGHPWAPLYTKPPTVTAFFDNERSAQQVHHRAHTERRPHNTRITHNHHDEQAIAELNTAGQAQGLYAFSTTPDETTHCLVCLRRYDGNGHPATIHPANQPCTQATRAAPAAAAAARPIKRGRAVRAPRGRG